MVYAVEIKKYKPKGSASRTAAHSEDKVKALMDKLQKDADKWMQNASKATDVYKQRLKEYLDYYIPAIEKYYLEELKNLPNPDLYYEKSVTGMNLRADMAIKIFKKTKELADKWRKISGVNARQKVLGGMAAGTYVSKEGQVIRL